MLKKEKIVVWVDETYHVEEISPEDSAKFKDELLERFSKKGVSEKNILVEREFFVKRLKDWNLTIDCTDENKRDFYNEFQGKAAYIMIEAQTLIEKKKEEALGNLLGGAIGT